MTNVTSEHANQAGSSASQPGLAKASWRNQVRTIAEHRAKKILVYGPPKVGKTSLAAAAPDSVIIDFDKGAGNYGVTSIAPPKTWEEALRLVDGFAKDPCGTLAIDTIDGLERLAAEHVCNAAKKKSLAEFGYGDGYTALAAEWRIALDALEAVRDAGTTVLLIGHAQVKRMQNPQIGEYDVFSVTLEKKTWAATHKWCDVIAFANFDAARKEEERRAFVTGQRLLYTAPGTGYEAGNRFGLPPVMPLEWTALAAGLNRWRDVSAEILTLAHGTKFEETAKAYVANAGEDCGKLDVILESLKKGLGK